jgi:hypothetical protein
LRKRLSWSTNAVSIKTVALAELPAVPRLVRVDRGIKEGVLPREEESRLAAVRGARRRFNSASLALRQEDAVAGGRLSSFLPLVFMRELSVVVVVSVFVSVGAAAAWNSLV